MKGVVEVRLKKCKILCLGFVIFCESLKFRHQEIDNFRTSELHIAYMPGHLRRRVPLYFLCLDLGANLGELGTDFWNGANLGQFSACL